ncbi:MAG: sigma-70 family RNA polymerase sigma factor [Thermoleophilia bacterium]|nr:sigma-70 family RNA polymerase sigma factor [Thermoleophilia bacterium]
MTEPDETPTIRATPEPADHALLSAIAAGDKQAFTEFYGRYSRYVMGLASRMLVDRTVAEDAVQDIFLEVWRRAGKYDPARASVATWLGRMAHSRVIDRARFEKSQSRSALSTDAGAESGSDEQIRGISGDAAPAAEDEVLEQLRHQNVREALAQLPKAHLEAITLMYFGGLSQSEVAERCGLPLGTVKTRVFHGMRRLHQLLVDGDREVRAR